MNFLLPWQRVVLFCRQVKTQPLTGQQLGNTASGCFTDSVQSVSGQLITATLTTSTTLFNAEKWINNYRRHKVLNLDLDHKDPERQVFTLEPSLELSNPTLPGKHESQSLACSILRLILYAQHLVKHPLMLHTALLVNPSPTRPVYNVHQHAVIR